MQGPRDIVIEIATVFEAAQTRYFVTGSIASMAYGEVRPTLDVDVVVDLRYGDAEAIAAHFCEPDWYLSRAAMLDAMQVAGQFNAISNTSAYKIDFMVVEPHGYNKVRFSRARTVLIGGTQVKFAAPEDVILMKLRYFKESKHERHLRDITSMLRISGQSIDPAYLQLWAEQLGVSEEIRRVISEDR